MQEDPSKNVSSESSLRDKGDLSTQSSGASNDSVELEISDAMLMARICEGQHQAFSDLYDRYSPRVFGLALRILHSQSEAEALVSDVFLEIWRKPELFDESQGTLQTYILMMTRSRGIDRIRASRTRLEKTTAVAEERATLYKHQEYTDTPYIAAIAEERQLLVRKALEQLQDDQREPLNLAFFSGMTHREIAEQLDEPLGTIKTRIRTGLAKLRSSLASEGADHVV